MNILDKINKEGMRKDIPVFRTGDTVKVHCKIKEGEKFRIQIFEGIVIKRSRGMKMATFTVRKLSYGIGVERVFMIHSPLIEKIEVSSRGEVKKARLYYLRGRTGKAAKVKEKIWEKVIESAFVPEEGAVDVAEGKAVKPDQPAQS